MANPGGRMVELGPRIRSRRSKTPSEHRDAERQQRYTTIRNSDGGSLRRPAGVAVMQATQPGKRHDSPHGGWLDWSVLGRDLIERQVAPVSVLPGAELRKRLPGVWLAEYDHVVEQLSPQRPGEPFTMPVHSRCPRCGLDLADAQAVYLPREIGPELRSSRIRVSIQQE